jgi:hypothetical protein
MMAHCGHGIYAPHEPVGWIGVLDQALYHPAHLTVGDGAAGTAHS